MEASDITSRAEKVSTVVLAEMYHFHHERVVDFRDMMKFFLQEQIDFYKRVCSASLGLDVDSGCGWMLIVGVVLRGSDRNVSVQYMCSIGTSTISSQPASQPPFPFERFSVKHTFCCRQFSDEW